MRPLARAAAAGALLFSLAASASEEAATAPAAAPAAAAEAAWSLRWPEDGRVVFRGMASFDSAGTGAAPMAYPAAGAAGFVAAVFTHGLLVDSAKRKQKEKLQAEADLVLARYRPVLDKFEVRDLMRRALEKTRSAGAGRIVAGSGETGLGMSVQSSPMFSLTPDENAIVLDNEVAIVKPGAAPDAGYRNTIRVVSAARTMAEPSSFWLAEDGEKLKDESARLVAESLDIAFAETVAGAGRDSLPYRTIRYRQGAAEQIERAQVLSEHCDRLVVRTLRGTLMSVPAARPVTLASGADSCRAPAVSPN